MHLESRITWRACRTDEGHGEKSAVCNQNFETGRKIRASRSIRLDLLKWSEKVGEWNWTPESQENTIPTPGLITLTGRLWIVTKVHKFGDFQNRGLMIKFIEDC